MELKATEWEQRGPVGIVRLSRPHRHNAWTGRMHHEYRWLIDRAESSPDVRAIVVTGSGRSFCVGADSDALAGHVTRGSYDPGTPEQLPQPGYGVRAAYDADFVFQFGLTTPVIAAVNGACAGVGFVLACCADLRVAAATARCATANARLGLPAEFGLSWVLPRLIGATRAAELLLTGRKFTAAEAAEWGLFNAVTESAEAAVERAVQLGEAIAEMGPAAVATTKWQLYRDLDGDLLTAVNDAAVLMADAMTGEEFAAGVAALRTGRPADFPRFDPETAPWRALPSTTTERARQDRRDGC